jgi:hypothetical protein
MIAGKDSAEETTMAERDSFSEYYRELLDDTYDCVDRIVVNAYFRFAQLGGGFRIWWRRLYGGDDNLDDTHLMRMAGRFSRRVRGWAKKNGIPVIYCQRGERKHKIAEKVLSKDPEAKGIFLVLISRAPAPVWEAERYGKGGLDLHKKDPMPYVNHYWFHIIDEDWGHVTVKMSGHPPFGAQVILNGHEYVARQASQEGIGFSKEGNCFTKVSDPAGLSKVADTLRGPHAVGRLTQVCRRWLYPCLRFALDVAEQRKSRFVYDLSVHQAEYSRNLLFKRGSEMEQIFNGVIDRTRAPLDIRTVKTIFGYKHRPCWRRSKKGPPRFEAVVEKPVYNLTVFKVHLGKQTLKIYTKGERVLRIEAITHNTKDLRCGRVVERFPKIVSRLAEMVERFLEVLRCLDVTWISDDTLDKLPQPSVLGKSRVAGIDTSKPRIRAVMEAVVVLSPETKGFRVSELAAKVQERMDVAYSARQASYDLKKLRAKGLALKLKKTRRYTAPGEALRTMAGLMTLQEKVIKPLLARAVKRKPGARPKNRVALDGHYDAVQVAMQGLFQALKIAA